MSKHEKIDTDDVDWVLALKIDHMICYQNWHMEEDRSNYNELTMLRKAAISVC